MRKRWIGYRELVGELIKHTDDKISVIKEFRLIYYSDALRAGAELVWSVCMLMKMWLEDMVSADTLEKVVVSSIEQFGDDRRVASAKAQPFTAT